MNVQQQRYIYKVICLKFVTRIDIFFIKLLCEKQKNKQIKLNWIESQSGVTEWTHGVDYQHGLSQQSDEKD